MDHGTIEAIATEVAKQLPQYSWTTLAIQVALTGAVAAVAAYWGAYLKKGGEHLATKAHFEEILRQLAERTDVVEKIKAEVAKGQLAANTTIVETIRSEIALGQVGASTKIVEAIKSEFGQRDWAAREWASLRREKIEELLSKMNESREYLTECMLVAEQGQEPPKGDPINGFETIAQLYFPELEGETTAFTKMHRDMVFEGLKLRIFLSYGGEEAKQRKSEFATKAAQTNVRVSPKAVAKLTEAARALLVKIMGVGTQSEAAVPQNDVA